MASEKPTWTGKGLESLGELNGGAGNSEDPPKPEAPPSPEASSVDAGTPPMEEPPKAPQVGDQQGIRPGSIEDEYGKVHDAERTYGTVFRPNEKNHWYDRLKSMMKAMPGERPVNGGVKPPGKAQGSSPDAQDKDRYDAGKVADGRTPAKGLERTKKEQFIESPKKGGTEFIELLAAKLIEYDALTKKPVHDKRERELQADAQYKKLVLEQVLKGNKKIGEAELRATIEKELGGLDEQRFQGAFGIIGKYVRGERGGFGGGTDGKKKEAPLPPSPDVPPTPPESAEAKPEPGVAPQEAVPVPPSAGAETGVSWEDMPLLGNGPERVGASPENIDMGDVNRAAETLVSPDAIAAASAAGGAAAGEALRSPDAQAGIARAYEWFKGGSQKSYHWLKGRWPELGAGMATSATVRFALKASLGPGNAIMIGAAAGAASGIAREGLKTYRKEAAARRFTADGIVRSLQEHQASLQSAELAPSYPELIKIAASTAKMRRAFATGKVVGSAAELEQLKTAHQEVESLLIGMEQKKGKNMEGYFEKEKDKLDLLITAFRSAENPEAHADPEKAKQIEKLLKKVRLEQTAVSKANIAKAMAKGAVVGAVFGGLGGAAGGWIADKVHGTYDWIADKLHGAVSGGEVMPGAKSASAGAKAVAAASEKLKEAAKELAGTHHQAATPAVGVFGSETHFPLDSKFGHVMHTGEPPVSEGPFALKADLHGTMHPGEPAAPEGPFALRLSIADMQRAAEVAEKAHVAGVAAKEIAKGAKSVLVGEQITAVAEAGDSQTTLAREAIHKFLADRAAITPDVGKNLDIRKLVFMEDWLMKHSYAAEAGKMLKIGDAHTFSLQEVTTAQEMANKLSEKQLENIGTMLSSPEHHIAQKTATWMTNLQEAAPTEPDGASAAARAGSAAKSAFDGPTSGGESVASEAANADHSPFLPGQEDLPLSPEEQDFLGSTADSVGGDAAAEAGSATGGDAAAAGATEAAETAGSAAKDHVLEQARASALDITFEPGKFDWGSAHFVLDGDGHITNVVMEESISSGAAREALVEHAAHELLTPDFGRVAQETYIDSIQALGKEVAGDPTLEGLEGGLNILQEASGRSLAKEAAWGIYQLREFLLSLADPEGPEGQFLKDKIAETIHTNEKVFGKVFIPLEKVIQREIV